MDYSPIYLLTLDAVIQKKQLVNCGFQTLDIKNLFGVLCRFQHCTDHITTGSLVGRGNQNI